jgi:hypothetical protein
MGIQPNHAILYNEDDLINLEPFSVIILRNILGRMW